MTQVPEPKASNGVPPRIGPVWLVTFAILVACTVYLGYRFLVLIPIPDSDQFFHFAISKMTSENGLLRSVPQVTGLGWDKSYPEKEFLYHVLTTVAYGLGGDFGIRVVAVVLLAITVCIIASFCRNHRLKDPVALALGVMLLLSDNIFLNRMFLVRPHTLATPLLLLVCLGIVRGSRILALMAAAAYALAYHAFYLPFAIASIAFLYSIAMPSHISSKEVRQAAIAAAGGIVLGILINPYFPANLEMGIMHLAFSFGRAGNDVLIGSELLPVPLLAQILRSPAIFGSLFLMVLVFATLAKERRNGEASLVIAFSLLFFLITAISPRGFEYMAPLTALAVVTVMSSLTGRARLIIATLLSFGIFWQAYGVYDFLLLNDNLKLSAGRQSAVDAVAALPTSTGSKMVFNCTFAIGPYLLYKRPDLHFIDILDPRLLLGYAPELFRARNDLVNGRVVETYEVLRNVFLADYVLCTDPPLIAKMEKDPRFRRLFPASTPTDDDLINRRVFAYELK